MFDELTIDTMREHGFARHGLRTGVWSRRSMVDFVGQVDMEIRLATPTEAAEYLGARPSTRKPCSQVFTFTIITGGDKASKPVDQGELMDAMAHFVSF